MRNTPAHLILWILPSATVTYLCDFNTSKQPSHLVVVASITDMSTVTSPTASTTQQTAGIPASQDVKITTDFYRLPPCARVTFVTRAQLLAHAAYSALSRFSYFVSKKQSEKHPSTSDFVRSIQRHSWLIYVTLMPATSQAIVRLFSPEPVFLFCFKETK